MSNSPDDKADENADDAPEDSGLGISDHQLPEDLVPGEDNPLAEGLGDGETVDDLMEGKPAEQSEDAPESSQDAQD